MAACMSAAQFPEMETTSAGASTVLVLDRRANGTIEVSARR